MSKTVTFHCFSFVSNVRLSHCLSFVCVCFFQTKHQFTLTSYYNTKCKLRIEFSDPFKLNMIIVINKQTNKCK